MLSGESEGLVARHGDPEHLVPMLGQEPGDAAGEQFAVVADDDARERVACRPFPLGMCCRPGTGRDRC